MRRALEGGGKTPNRGQNMIRSVAGARCRDSDTGSQKARNVKYAWRRGGTVWNLANVHLQTTAASPQQCGPSRTFCDSTASNAQTSRGLWREHAYQPKHSKGHCGSGEMPPVGQRQSNGFCNKFGVRRTGLWKYRKRASRHSSCGFAGHASLTTRSFVV